MFENLRRCLAQAGAHFDDVVKLTFFVLDVADLAAVRAARDAVIDTTRPPASTAVQVTALFAPGYLLEVEAWALVDDSSGPCIPCTSVTAGDGHLRRMIDGEPVSPASTLTVPNLSPPVSAHRFPSWPGRGDGEPPL